MGGGRSIEEIAHVRSCTRAPSGHDSNELRFVRTYLSVDTRAEVIFQERARAMPAAAYTPRGVRARGPGGGLGLGNRAADELGLRPTRATIVVSNLPERARAHTALPQNRAPLPARARASPFADHYHLKHDSWGASLQVSISRVTPLGRHARAAEGQAGVKRLTETARGED